MRYLTLIATLFAPTFAHAAHHEDKQFSKDDCKAVYGVIQLLLSEADKSWKALETTPEGTPAFIEHTMKIKWAMDVAGNYTIIYDSFCDDK